MVMVATSLDDAALAQADLGIAIGSGADVAVGVLDEHIRRCVAEAARDDASRAIERLVRI